MKAQEIRIGNKVMINAGLHEPGIYTVEAITSKGSLTEDKRVIFFKEDNGDTGEFLMHLEPVPLTEEWLKKFGFIHHGADGYSCDEKSTLGFYFSTKNGLLCNVFYRRTIPSDNVKGCFYVHEFQNLFFALTGQEL